LVEAIGGKMNKQNTINEAMREFKQSKIDSHTFWEVFNNNKSSSKYEPWHTKEWQDNRAKKLKDKCECCGSTDRLTIQHTWHPRGFKKLKESIMSRPNYHEGLEKHMSTFDEPKVTPTYETRECCPHCDGISISHRKTTNDYRCNTSQSQTIDIKSDPEVYSEWEDTRKSEYSGNITYKKVWSRNPDIWKRVVNCKKIFKNPKVRQYEKRTKEQNIASERWKHQRSFWLNEATETWIEENERYIEIRDEDHITACHKCAYEQDKAAGLISKSKKL